MTDRVIYPKEIVKARIDGENIRCGVCGHIIATFKGVRFNLGVGTIYLMCRKRGYGEKCRAMNEVNL